MSLSFLCYLWPDYNLIMANKGLFPDYIFESSWEVCNKVGGIYAVLSTRARTLCNMLGDHLIFIGPDCWKTEPCPYFKEDKALFADWRKKASSEGLTSIRSIQRKTRSMASCGKTFRWTAFMLTAITTRHRCSLMLPHAWSRVFIITIFLQTRRLSIMAMSG